MAFDTLPSQSFGSTGLEMGESRKFHMGATHRQ